MPLPSVRDLFIPDPGCTICDVDLSGADAQVVAWEAEDDNLKAAFRRGLKIHSHNAITVEPDLGPYEHFEKVRKDGTSPRVTQAYADIKRAAHGTNYGARPRTISITLGWSVRKAERFQEVWFREHPGILTWHRKVERDLIETRRVRNSFGYHRIYFDRPDNCFTQALAWIPQSTVAIVTARADKLLTDYFTSEQTGAVLLQVHDSLVFQTRTDVLRPTLRTICDLLHGERTRVPYPDPLQIPWGLKLSDRSWGHCRDMKWEDLL